MNNPYATALDGLILDDPVLLFLIFVVNEKKFAVSREKMATISMDR